MNAICSPWPRVSTWKLPRAFGAIAFITLTHSSPATAATMTSTGTVVPGFEQYDQEIPALLQKWSVPGAAVAVAYQGEMDASPRRPRPT